MAGIENVQRYRPGGYHPVHIGDTLSKYTVLHKLGYGGFSTVWLVKRDRTPIQPIVLGAAQPPVTSFHALKILCSDVGDMAKNNEMAMLHPLGELGTYDHPNIVTLEDSFDISGPNMMASSAVSFSPFSGRSLACAWLKVL
jgi:serine/threonine protein kinase